MPIRVNVLMITYKHEAFIEQAINSVLIQEGNFDLELIIGDDYSPDNTEKIIREIILNHPKGNQIKYHKNDINLGMEGNFRSILEKCNGDYIALCDGDDFWTDKFKVSKQINILELQKEFIACFHNVKKIDDQTQELGNVYEHNLKKYLGIMDLVNGDYMKTVSLLFRNDLNLLQPIFNKKIPADDTSLGFCLLSENKAVYIDEVMAAYRIHPGGIWSSLNQNKKDNWSIRSLFIYLKYFESNKNVYQIIKNKLLLTNKNKIKRNIKELNFISAIESVISILRTLFT